MRAHPEASPDDIDVTRLASAIKARLPRILLGSLLLGALTFGCLSLIDPRFSSETQLMIGGRGVSDPFRDPKSGTTTPDVVTVKVDKEAINSQVQALKSRDLATRIAKELKLAERPEFNPALPSPGILDRALRIAGLAGPRPGETESDSVLAAYYKRLMVAPGKESRVINVEFSSSDPDLAARIANALAEFYQDWLRSQGVMQTTDASEWLKPQIEKLTREVAESEAEVERFRGKAGLLTSGGTGNVTLNQQQLAELNSELAKAQGARSEAEARAKAAREMMKSGSADVLADVQKSPTMQGLVQKRSRVEQTIAELSATLLPGHPRMQQLQAELAGLKRQIAIEVAKLVDSLDKEAKVAALREDTIRKRLEEIKSRVVSTSTDEVQLKQIEAKAKAKRKELDALLASYESAQARRDARAVPLEASILSRAQPSSVPVFPKKAPLSALAATAGLLLGLVWVITREMLAGARPRSMPHGSGSGTGGGSRLTGGAPSGAVATAAAALSSASGLMSPEAGHSPVKHALPDAGPVAAAEAERFSEVSSIGSLAGALAARGAELQVGFRTMLVGSGLERSWAAETCELASALEASGSSVIIVDVCAGEGGLAAAFDVQGGPGLAELVDGRASFEDVIRRVPESDAHYVTGGARLDLIAEADAERINLVLDALDEAYDHILITGDRAKLKRLFEMLQGRIDAGVLIGSTGASRPIDAAPGVFLGYDVTDIEVFRLEMSGISANGRRAPLSGQEGGAHTTAAVGRA
jgi:uncharacterized protein involved in exopolysaccharide biosynthesis